MIEFSIFQKLKRAVPKKLLPRFMTIVIVPITLAQILTIFLFYDRHWYNVSYHTSKVITNEIASLIEDSFLLSLGSLKRERIKSLTILVFHTKSIKVISR
jgi:hypothetical protein